MGSMGRPAEIAVGPAEAATKGGHLDEATRGGSPLRNRRRTTAGRRSQPNAVLATAVLVLLLEQDGHGYDLAARLPSLGLEQPAAGSLYRTLRSLEGDGFLSSCWDGSARGPARHVYRVTAAGRRHLAGSIEAIRIEARLLDGLAHRFCSFQPPRAATGEH